MTILHVEKIKRLLLVTIGLMVALMVYYVWQYNRGRGEVKPKTVLLPEKTVADPAIPNVIVNDVDLTEMSGGRILWTLHAKNARVYSELKETRLKGVEVEFFDEQGEKSLNLISERGVKDDNTGNIIASGNVRVTSLQKDATLKTEKLYYDAEQKKIRTDKDQYVIIEQAELITSGYGLESDVGMSSPRILRDVTTSFVKKQHTQSEEGETPE